MAAKRSNLALLVALPFFLAAPIAAAFAEGPDASSPGNAAPDEEVRPGAAPTGETQAAPLGYRFTIDDGGNPVYTQELSWENDPNALEYEIAVRDAEGNEIIRKTITENRLEMSLVPGDYSYNIITRNLLGQNEAETGFQPLSIIRAEVPSIEGTSPAFIFMDSMNALITVRGKKILEGARVFIQHRGNAAAGGIEGIEQERDGDGEIVIRFPDDAYVPGTFDITVVNPGGLSAKMPNTLRIMYQRPIDVLVSAGYAPIAFTQDAWFTKTWPEPLYPLGADASLSVFFLKKAWGFLGIEIAASGHMLTGGGALTQLTSWYLLSGANVAYKFRISKVFHILARAGGGVAFSYHDFDYSGKQGPEAIFSCPYVDAGLALQAFFPNKMFIELGADWVEILDSGHAIGGVRPALKIGYQLF